MTICLLLVDIIKLEDSEFLNTPREIVMNPRFMSHFKVKQTMYIAIVDINIVNIFSSHYL